MSKKTIEKPKEIIDESENVMFDDIDECCAAAEEFLRTHPNYYDHSDIPSEPMTHEQFVEWWHKKVAE